ncbi:MAG: tyrosine recombinase [Chloroflexi bacterium]|nr:tyrosine recombinase [Chloroflexota bacterium]
MDATIEDFVEHLRIERGLSANTLSAYRSDLNQFREYMARAERGSWSVPPAFVRQFMNELVQREYEPSSQARKLAALKSLYRYLLSSGVVSSDPTAGLDGARVKKRLPQTLSRAQVERVLQEAARGREPDNLRDRAMLEALYATGMRVSELAALDLADVDQAEETITLARNGAGERRVPLRGRALAAVEDYLAAGRARLKPSADEPALFLNHRGARLTRQGFWLIVKTYARRAGIKAHITPHTLRHSFAEHRLRADGNVRQVQRMLGHASLATTQIYAELAAARHDDHEAVADAG